MKAANLLLLVLTTLWPLGTRAQPSPCITIQKAYAALDQRATRHTEEAFLRAFPATYSSFTAVFGYSGRSSPTTSIHFGCLYDRSTAYVEHLFALRQVPRANVFAKLVGIARHARWQSDGLNWLQDHSIALATTDSNFLAFLNAQPVADIRSFTRFLLLNPVSNEPLRRQLKEAYAPYNHLHAAWL